MSEQLHPYICDQMIVAIPRCLCGASVGNCIRERCYQVLTRDKTAPIRLEQWRELCLANSPDCKTDTNKEVCSIVYNHEAINRHNRRVSRKKL